MTASALRWVLSLCALAAALWIAVLNGTVVVRRYVLRSGRPSWIPILGGALGLAGMLLVPSPALARYCWLPLVLDMGCLPGAVGTLIWLVAARRARRG